MIPQTASIIPHSLVTLSGHVYNMYKILIFSVQKDYKHLYTTDVTKSWTITEGYTEFAVNPYPRRGRVCFFYNSLHRIFCNVLLVDAKIMIQIKIIKLWYFHVINKLKNTYRVDKIKYLYICCWTLAIFYLSIHVIKS